MPRVKREGYVIGRETERGNVVLAPFTERNPFWDDGKAMAHALLANQGRDPSVRAIRVQPGMRLFPGQMTERGLRRKATLQK